MSVRRGITTAVLPALLAACAGPAPPPIVVVTTAADAGAAAEGSAVDALITRDAEAAAAALAAALREPGDPAALAAVYALRLGVRHDPGAVRAAVRRGTGSRDDLVAALCWRWVAAGPAEEPPEWQGGAAPDPVVAALAAAAFARLDRPWPLPLAGALGLPERGPSDRDPAVPGERVGPLRRAAIPYDDGPLALAVAFVAARRERWIDRGPGGRRFAAAGLRAELVAALGGGAVALARLESARTVSDPMYSALAARLDSPLAGSPPSLLRGAVVKGDQRLRVDALRALAVAAVRPEAGDLGAAASALGRADPLTRVEAARTYLLLAARATE